jgi:uncharacterized protein YoxC
MATKCLAMWVQDADIAHMDHMILIFIGLVSIAMVVMAIAMIVVALTAAKALKGMSETAVELKGKIFPLIETATEISKTSHGMLDDVAPKVKTITDNLVTASDTLVETSKSARAAVQQFDTTITDVNMRTQRQVARVDGMVTAAINTTAEIVDTIGNGIRGPAQKIAVAATQAKNIIEALIAKLRSRAPGARTNP